MRLTTKGRFAVTAMLDIALRQNGGPVSLASVSERQRISLSYLEQLFGRLRKHQLVASTRGPGGGYGLGRRPQDITIADIILAVDEPLDATGCGGKENCHGDENGGPCMTHNLWSNLNRKMVEYLDSVHLKKLVDDYLLENKDFVASVHTLKPMSYRPLQVDAPNSVFALGQPTQRKTL